MRCSCDHSSTIFHILEHCDMMYSTYSSCVVTKFRRGKLNLCDWNFRSVVSCDWIFSSVVSCVGLGRQIRPEIWPETSQPGEIFAWPVTSNPNFRGTIPEIPYLAQAYIFFRRKLWDISHLKLKSLNLKGSLYKKYIGQWSRV